jgi:GDP-L-fucose synthase
VLHTAKEYKVDKLISLLSTCIYPDVVSYPLKEEDIHLGDPHLSNFAYAYAKRMLDVQSRAYRKQHGCDFITVVLNNLFGENDNFDYENSHVIPAMIRKIYEAKQNNGNVVLWGNGEPLREFTYSGDLAEILLFLFKNYEGSRPINIGCTNEYSIKQAAEYICSILDYDVKNIVWDTDKPMGQYRKPSDKSKLLSLGWKKHSHTDFKFALEKTCNWFIKNYPNVRGIN